MCFKIKRVKRAEDVTNTLTACVSIFINISSGHIQVSPLCDESVIAL